MDSEGACLIWRGRMFQSLGPANLLATVVIPADRKDSEI